MPGFHVSAYARKQVLERVERLAREGLDVASFLSEAGAALDRAVPSGIDAVPAPTWMTLDPASLLLTSMVSEGCTMPWSAEEMVWLEYSSEMVGNRVGDVVRNPLGVQTAHELVESDPVAAGEYVELLQSMGAAHEALVALRARDGQHWGAVYLAREPGRPDFSSEELDFLRAVAPHLAEGVRRGLLAGEACEPEGPDAPAIVVLGADLTPESFTPGAQQWLSDLPVRKRSELPAAVLSVAQVALAGRGEGRRWEPASARVLSERRGWVMLHGQALAGSGGRRVAVTIQPAGPDRISPLLMAAYGLTEREEEVTRHVLQGDSTGQIAEALCISPYTVQEHLKHIFEKTSVRSRRELMSRVFARHYQPRVEDNHERVRVDRTIRGGPFPDRSAQRVGTTHHEPA
jgi:DNA-binding CsgD family transcriptional regulator